MDKVLSSTSYSEKQNAFKIFVKEIQASLGSKEYQKKGLQIEEFVKMKWNISKAQAYRYVVCAKVLDQLKEFDILPCHERLCRSLNNTARTTAQLKLLWSTVIRKFKPENINSTNVVKVWKELYADEKYYDICHYEDNIIKKVENSLNKLSYQMKTKQLKQNKQLSHSISYTNSSSLSDLSISNQSGNSVSLPLSESYVLNQSENNSILSLPINNECLYNPIYTSNSQLGINNNYAVLPNNQYDFQFQFQPQLQLQLQPQPLIYYQANTQPIVYCC